MKQSNRKILVCVLLAALVLCLFAEVFLQYRMEAERDPVSQIMKGMTLQDKLAQMMFFSPRTWKDDDASEDTPQKVTALNEEQRQFIAEHGFGGILLFAENCEDAEQMLRLTAELRNAAGEGGIMPFVAMDQEGGVVARLGFGTTGPGNMYLAAAGDPGYARDMARVYGEELSLLGIGVDFAPVVDVNDNAANPVIGVRSFSDDPDITGEYGGAFIAGLQDTGTIACIKHFPGHGNTGSDSHTGLPLVDRSYEELLNNELIPFKSAVDAGVEMVMTAHIQYPQIEPQTYTSALDGEQIFLPATMSKTILTDILRKELGFTGVIVGDAMDMQAIWDNFSYDDMLAMSINAGVDMIILPCNGSWDLWTLSDELLARVVELAGNGTIDPARIDDSVRRILTLKQKYGLLGQPDITVTDDMVSAAVNGCGSPEHRQIAWDIAEKALTLLKNENNAFPMYVQPGEKTLILFSAGSRVGAGDLSRQILEEMGALPEGAEIESMVIEKDTAAACIEAARSADRVLFVSRAWSLDCLDPETEDGYPVGVINSLIDELHQTGKTAIVISAQLPYDAACYPEADAILLSYCSSVMRSIPNAFGAGSAWAPNLPAAICAAFGTAEPSGTLPVNLPKLDADYHLTGEILYARSRVK